MKINVIIFGATGSIGSSVISIISKNTNYINLEGITCNSKIYKLYKIAKSFNVKKIGFNEKSIRKNKLNLKQFSVYNETQIFITLFHIRRI